MLGGRSVVNLSTAPYDHSDYLLTQTLTSQWVAPILVDRSSGCASPCFPSFPSAYPSLQGDFAGPHYTQHVPACSPCAQGGPICGLYSGSEARGTERGVARSEGEGRWTREGGKREEGNGGREGENQGSEGDARCPSPSFDAHQPHRARLRHPIYVPAS